MDEYISTLNDDQPTRRVSVVYDSENGDVVHVHEFIGDGEGIFAPDAERDRSRMALEAAQRTGATASLDVIEASRDFRLEPEARYRVDLSSRVLQKSEIKGVSERLQDLIKRRQA